MSQSSIKNQYVPLSMALFCVLVWGISYAAIRFTVQEIPPLTLACLRHLGGAMLLWPLVRFRSGREISIAPKDRGMILAMALSGISCYFAFENYGLKLTTASHAALIIAVIPLGTELVLAWRHRRLPGRGIWLGTAAALTGVIVLVSTSSGEASLSGDLLMFGAVGSWVVYTFLVERSGNRYPRLLLTRQIMWYGGLTLIPGMIWELTSAPLVMPSPTAWGGFIFLTVVCSALGYVFWNSAIPALGPSRTNTLLYLLPLVGVCGGVILLDEPLDNSLFAGGGLVLAGVFLAGRSRRPKATETEVEDAG